MALKNPQVVAFKYTAITDLDGVNVADVKSLPNNIGALEVAIVDSSGNQVSNFGGTGGNAAAGPTGSPVPANADYIGFNVGGNLVGVSASNPLPITGTISAASDLVDTANSTVSPLGAGSTFTGSYVSTLGYSSLTVMISTDQLGTLSIVWSNDGVNGALQEQYNYNINDIDAGNGIGFSFSIKAKYYELSFTNTAVAPETYLRLQSILKVASQNARVALAGLVSVGAIGDPVTTDVCVSPAGELYVSGQRVHGIAISSPPSFLEVGGWDGSDGFVIPMASGGTSIIVSGNVGITGTVGVTQSTSPWITSDNHFSKNLNQDGSGNVGVNVENSVAITGTVGISGSVAVTQSTSPWVISGTVNQGNSGSNAQAWWEQIGDTVNGPVAVKPAINTTAYPPVFTTAGATNADPALVTSLSPNSGIPAIIQKTSGTGSGSQSSLSTSNFTNPVKAGNSIVVVVGAGGAGTPTVTDTLGNSYALAVQFPTGGFQVSIWYATNIIGGVNAVTVAPSVGSTSLALAAYEVSGIIGVGGQTNSVLNGSVPNQNGSLGDSTANSSSGSTSISSTNLPVTSFPNEIAFGGISIGTAAQTPTNYAPWSKDFTLNIGGSPSGLFSLSSFSQPLGASGAIVNLSANIPVSEPWICAIAAFRPAITAISGIVSGTLMPNSAAPASHNIGVLPAIATAAGTSYSAGNQVLLATDLNGNLNVDLQSYANSPVSPINPIFVSISDGTNSIASAVTAYGKAPTGSVMGVNAFVTNLPLATGGSSVIVSGSSSGSNIGIQFPTNNQDKIADLLVQVIARLDALNLNQISFHQDATGKQNFVDPFDLMGTNVE